MQLPEFKANPECTLIKAIQSTTRLNLWTWNLWIISLGEPITPPLLYRPSLRDHKFWEVCDHVSEADTDDAIPTQHKCYADGEAQTGFGLEPAVSQQSEGKKQDHGHRRCNSISIIFLLEKMPCDSRRYNGHGRRTPDRCDCSGFVIDSQWRKKVRGGPRGWDVLTSQWNEKERKFP